MQARVVIVARLVAWLAGWLFVCVRRTGATSAYIYGFVGTGSTGSTGDGGAAASALLYKVTAVAVDTSGNVYLAMASRVRMVSASTGIITAFAGNSTTGNSPVFGYPSVAATSAMLNNPLGLAVDASGNVFIADTSNHMVRRVSRPSGIIFTVAGSGTGGSSGDGGPASSAMLSLPSGLAIDSSGNLYIADLNNAKVRLINAAGLTISTYAGNTASDCNGDGGVATSASLFFPYGVALDASSNLFICDRYNNNVRVVTYSTKIISNYAGLACAGRPAGSTTASTAGSTGDGGAATSAYLNGPRGIAVDASGNLYIADKV
jgi:hypothetical protein